MRSHPPTFKPTLPATRFAGYHWAANKTTKTTISKPTFWKAGTHEQDSALLEVFVPGSGSKAVEMNKTKDGRYWVAPTDTLNHVAGDTVYYRFWDDTDDIRFDLTERRTFDTATKAHPKGQWNVARKQHGPQRSGSMLYAYIDSMTLPDANSDDPLTDPLVTPAPTDSQTRYNGTIHGVTALLNKLNTSSKHGVGAVMLTPHSGDWDSAHRYWTADPFALNNAFPNKGDFNEFFLGALHKGVKVYCDGAFVNQGFASPLYQDLLLNGVRSPYWSWFVFDKGDPESASRLYPNAAVHHKMVVGTLPVNDNGQGALKVDWPRVGLRVINSPYMPDYDASRPVYLEQFDPTKKSEQQWLPGGQSTHPFRWPVSEDEFKTRLAHSSLATDTTTITSDQAANFLEWRHYRLGRPDEDNSGYKWDGKVQAIQMNMDNPEVQAYTRKALSYWTQRVQQLYRQHLATQLQHAYRQTHHWDKATKQVDSLVSNGELALTQAGLPNKALANLHRDNPDAPLPSGAALTNTLLTTVPPLSVDLPPDSLRLKALLSHPSSHHYLLYNQGARDIASPLLTPAKTLLGNQSALGKKITDWQNKGNVHAQLSSALASITEKLSPQAQQVLKHPLGQELFASSIGPALWQTVFTGQPETGPETVKQQLSKRLGPKVLLQDVATSRKHLREQMLHNIAALPLTHLAQQATQQLEAVSPESLVIADHLIQQKELGLNWRLDAAKDIADIDTVRNAPDTLAQQRAFKKEMHHATVLWGSLLAGVKRIFPKSTIIAELTEMTPLGGVEGGKEALDKLLTPQAKGQSSLFGGPVNMDYFFSSLLQLIHHDPKPYEYGQTQLQVDNAENPGQSFWKSALKPFVYNHAKETAQLAQTFTASHDYSNTLYNLLRNPMINGMDYYPYRGVDQDVRDVLNTIASKPDFATLRNSMTNAGMTDPQEALENLANLAQELTLDELPSLLHDFYREEDKRATMEKYNLGQPPQNMKKLRLQLGKLLLSLAVTERCDDADDWKAALNHPVLGKMIRNQLETAFNTTSEVWATRAFLANGYQQYAQQSGLAHLPKADAFYDMLTDTLNTWSQQHPRLPGYMSLAKLVDEIGSRLYPKNPTGRTAAAFKHDFFQHLLTPALEKDRRRIALMVALPGQPTWYDIFRTGGERTNNKFMQNREPVRLDWLDNPQMDFIQKEFNVIRNLLAIRQQYPVINGGFLQNITQDDTHGVLLAAWDGGPAEASSNTTAATPETNQQIIMMVNTGKPSPVPGEYYDNILGATNEQYPEIHTTQASIEKYEPDIHLLDQPAGTVYKNPENNDEYTVDDDGTLKLTRGTGTLHTYAVLVRQAGKPSNNTSTTNGTRKGKAS